MPVRVDAVVFEQLTLERLCLGEFRREGGIAPAVGKTGSDQADPSPSVVREHREDFTPFLRTSALGRQGTERREADPLGTDLDAGLPKVHDRKIRDIRSTNREAVPGPERCSRAHHYWSASEHAGGPVKRVGQLWR
jgi:hypothetical protein